MTLFKYDSNLKRISKYTKQLNILTGADVYEKTGKIISL